MSLNLQLQAFFPVILMLPLSAEHHKVRSELDKKIIYNNVYEDNI